MAKKDNILNDSSISNEMIKGEDSSEKTQSKEFDKSDVTSSVLSFVTAMIGIVAHIICVALGGSTIASIFEVIAYIFFILAVIFGISSLKEKKGIKGLAVAGLIIGGFFIGVVLIMLIVGITLSLIHA